MVAKIPKKIWNEWNIWKIHTKYGGNGTEEIQHTVSLVEVELEGVEVQENDRTPLIPPETG